MVTKLFWHKNQANIFIKFRDAPKHQRPAKSKIFNPNPTRKKFLIPELEKEVFFKPKPDPNPKKNYFKPEPEKHIFFQPEM